MPLRSLLVEPPDAHDVGCLVRALDAGSRGDPEGSLAQELAGTVILESPHRFIMQELIRQGDAAPAWSYSRWCVDLAWRSMLVAEDPRTDAAVRHVLAALYPDSVAQVLDDRTESLILGTKVAAGDRLAQDIALFEFGGLADYIEQTAREGLLVRTDRIREWAEAPMGCYEFVEFLGCRLVLRDLVEGGEVQVLNLGAMTEASDIALIGRVVPITSEPGAMFAGRPICVDLPTAQRVAEQVRTGEPLGWLWAMSLALREGAFDEGFHRTPATPYTSDLPMPEIVVAARSDTPPEAGRITELRANGHSLPVANALAVLEVGLVAATVSDGAAAVVSPHVATALSTPGVTEAAVDECCDPHTADAWRVLAAVVPDHLADRCRVLAGGADAVGQW